MAYLCRLHCCRNAILKLAGMSFFDALNHSMSTLSTGGFSTKNDSLAHWNDSPMIQYIVVFFMFLSGTNFVLSYFGFKGNFSKIFKDEEFKLYAKFIIVFSVISAFVVYYNSAFSMSSSFATNKFPVEEPTKSLIPQQPFKFFRSANSSTLSAVAPK